LFFEFLIKITASQRKRKSLYLSCFWGFCV